MAGRRKGPSDNIQRIQDFLLSLPDELFEKARAAYYADPQGARLRGKRQGERAVTAAKLRKPRTSETQPKE